MPTPQRPGGSDQKAYGEGVKRPAVRATTIPAPGDPALREKNPTALLEDAGYGETAFSSERRTAIIKRIRALLAEGHDPSDAVKRAVAMEDPKAAKTRLMDEANFAARESQYASSYLDHNHGLEKPHTPGTYLAGKLSGKAKQYSEGYHHALIRALDRRVGEGTALKVKSHGGREAYVHHDHPVHGKKTRLNDEDGCPPAEKKPIKVAARGGAFGRNRVSLHAGRNAIARFYAFGNPRVGGNYDAIDNGDGTFEIPDIPIFGRVPAGAKRNDKEIGEEWMKAALEKNRLRNLEGYLPPVHICHSDDKNQKPEYAGKFTLTRIGHIVYEGEQVPALFARIVGIPAHVFAEVRKGFIPYRSVEIHDWSNPEIDSLALMRTDVPYFRMEMTTIGRVIKRSPPELIHARTPAHSLRTVGAKGAMILFRFAEGGDMPPKKTAKHAAFAATDVRPGKIPDKGDITTKMNEHDVGPSSGTNTETLADDANYGGTAPGGEDNPEVGEFADGDTYADENEGGDDMDGGGDTASMLKAISVQLKSISTGLQQLLSHAKTNQPQAEPPESPEGDMGPVSGMAAAPKGGPAARGLGRAIERITLRAQGPVMARLKVVEKELGEARRSAMLSARIEKVEAELAGYNLDDETCAYFRRCAAVGDEFLDEAVQTFMRNTPPEPPEDAGEFEAMLATTPGAEEGINSFAAKHPGPEASEWVRMQATAHAAYAAQSGSEISLNEWLETNWKYENGNLPTGPVRV